MAGATAASSAPSKQDLLVGYDHVPTAADRAAITSAGGTVRHSFSSINVLAVNLPSAKASALRSQTGVSYVENDAIRTPLGKPAPAPTKTPPPPSLASTLATSELTPSMSNGLYGLVTTHAVEAQAAGYTGAGVKACVADTGLDTRHSDIAPNLVDTYDVFSGHEGLHATDVFDLGVQATETHATHVSGIVLGAINGTGIHGVAPNLVNTYDVFTGATGVHATDVFRLGVATTETHATHVAGIVLGADNGSGTLGVAPAAKLYHARVLGTQPDGSVSGETSQVMAGVQWLADQGCKVINMSLGGGDRSQAEEALYNQVIQDGTTIVVASGNDSASQVSFPGGYQNVLTVGAVDVNNQLASFSNTGAQLDLVGPGVDNLSSFPAGQGRDAFVTAGGAKYSALPAEFSGATSAYGINGPLVACGLGQAPSDCGGAAKGFVALIQRGAISFAAKVDNAMKAGASAVILYNNVAGSLNPTLGAPSADWIPTIALSMEDGQAVASSLTPTSSGTLFNVAMAWNLDSGTSMATPHVTGVAALIFGKNPKLTPDQVETIMERTATDLGVPNYDTRFGWGLVNAQAALAATPAP
jgi:subtilisin family serine protease